MNCPPEFAKLIGGYTRDFVGREWMFDEIDRWLADPNAPCYFVISGEPGIGKSTIAVRVTC